MNFNYYYYYYYFLEGESLTLIPCDLLNILEATILEYKQI